MNESRLAPLLAPVRRRWRCRRALTMCCIGWGIAAGLSVVAAFAGSAIGPLAALGVAGGIGSAALFAARFSQPGDRRLARLVESRHPGLESRLLTAVDLPGRATVDCKDAGVGWHALTLWEGRVRCEPRPSRTPSVPPAGFFERQLFDEVARHAATHDWRTCVPARTLLARLVGQALGCGVLLCAGLFARTPIAGEVATGENGLDAASPELVVEVEPGDAEIERGSDVLVTARFTGGVPARAVIVADGDFMARLDKVAGTGPKESPGRAVSGTSRLQSRPSSDRETARGDGGRSIPMVRHLDDPLFGGRIERVERDFTYRIETDGIRSPDFRVTVFEYPGLERVDATLIRPSWTGRPDETLTDARRVSVVEGSRIVWSLEFNKPVAVAVFEAEDGERIDVELIEPHAAAAAMGRVTIAPRQDRVYRLRIVDDAGRANREPPEFAVRLLPNRPPELKLAFPARDVRVSPIEELVVEGTAWDDFGLGRFGVVYEIPGGETRTLLLGESAAAREERTFSRTIPLEELGVRPGQLVAYHLFAEDVGPDGKPRRTLGDIFFAEVRPFEQIYREGQSPPGGGAAKSAGGEQDAPLEQLVQLQKQIVIATWKLRREQPASHREPALHETAATVAETQQAAIERLAAVRSKLNDLRQQKIAESVAEQMATALDQLRALGDPARSVDDAKDPLLAAVAAEQAAFEGLLKLQPREHRVVQGQPAGAGGAGGDSRSDQQLQQLELSARENRYQTERSDSIRADERRDERLQVLNRLRELAQRQAEINDALRRAEQDLVAARAAEEIEEARRRLKRLREEQQRLLQDVDRLRERTDRPDNQRPLADSREQLDRVRSQVRQASEALAAGRTSQALAEGARAEREMRQLGDELRQQAAGEFADAMRELRDQARELGREQQRIGDDLRQDESHPRQALRGSRRRERIEQELREQAQRFERVVADTERMMQQAEASEPLLSRGLHEALRDAEASRPREGLERAASELARGRPEEAQSAETQARRGIDALQRGVETAAADVLGSELENIRRARREVSDLAEAVRRELAGGGKPATPTEEIADAPAGIRQASAQSNAESSGRQSQSGSGEPPGHGDSQSGESAPRSRAGLRPAQNGRNGTPSAATSLASQADGGGPPGAPLTGSSDDFERWSDGLRAVEELVSDPRTRDVVRRIRDRAQQMRIEHRRHSKEPNRDLVRAEILAPLAEVRERLAEEIARQDEGAALVPLDRDPVPERYSEQVRRYYERLGGGP
ncbi:MAG: hypothetical protein WD069_12930 [Planctomycetales bacterium]